MALLTTDEEPAKRSLKAKFFNFPSAMAGSSSNVSFCLHVPALTETVINPSVIQSVFQLEAMSS